jgi:hypothetical protein
VPNAIAASTSTSAAKGNLVLKWPFVLQMIGILATGTALALAVL